MLNFVKCFSYIYWEDHVVLSFLCQMWLITFIDWFVHVEPSLWSWDESNLVMVYDLFYVLLDSGCCCCCWVTSVVSSSVWPHRWQPTRLPHPWDSPGKKTGVGCHFLLQCMKVKSESEVAQSCPTLSDPMDWSLPGSSIHGIFQARVLEWVAIAFSRDLVLGVNKLLGGKRAIGDYLWHKLWVLDATLFSDHLATISSNICVCVHTHTHDSHSFL